MYSGLFESRLTLGSNRSAKPALKSKLKPFLSYDTSTASPNSNINGVELETSWITNPQQPKEGSN